MGDSAAALDRAFHALAEPHRRAILATVRTGRRAVGEIADALGLSQQTTSHHLKVLRAADLVTSSRAGTRHLYAVGTEGLTIGRAFFEEFWPDHLQTLKRGAEAASGKDSGDV